MDSKIKVYIASPYAIGNKEENVHRSLDVANKLLKMGFVPYAPLLCHYWDQYSSKTADEWLKYDMEWLESCDMVLRLSGTSVGADAEVKLAESLNIPVVYDLDGLLMRITDIPFKREKEKVVSDTETMKFDDGKLEYSDLPELSIRSTTQVFNYGAKKYDKFNYSKGTKLLRYWDAARRHMGEWFICNDIDESGYHHIDHAIASLLILRENIHLGTGVDNRNPAYLKMKKKMGDGDFQTPVKNSLDEYKYHIGNMPIDKDGGLTDGEMRYLMRTYPNDADLGMAIRKRFISAKDKSKIVKSPELNGN